MAFFFMILYFLRFFKISFTYYDFIAFLFILGIQTNLFGDFMDRIKCLLAFFVIYEYIRLFLCINKTGNVPNLRDFPAIYDTLAIIVRYYSWSFGVCNLTKFSDLQEIVFLSIALQ